MPISRTKQKNAEIAARSAALPKIPKELMDQIVAGPMTGEQVNAATLAFKKALIERVMVPSWATTLASRTAKPATIATAPAPRR